MKDKPEFQLEFWVPKGRKGGAWVPQNAAPVGNYRTWRKVKVGHEHPDKLRHSITMIDRPSNRTRSQVCDDYCKWARLNGVQPTIYAGDPISRNAARAAMYVTETLRAVDVTDFIGPVSEPDTCEDCAA